MSIILITSVIHSYSQIEVDSMKIKSEDIDSLEIIVYTILPSCYLVDSVRYNNQSDLMSISFYYSEEFPQCDCSPCQRQDIFKIKKNTYKNIEFNSIIRNCLNNCANYTDYTLFATGKLSLTSVGIIENKKKSDLEISPNPAKDMICITKHSGDEFEIMIYDLYGNKCLEKKCCYSEIVNISTLPTGLYFLITNNNTFKFFKY